MQAGEICMTSKHGQLSGRQQIAGQMLHHDCKLSEASPLSLHAAVNGVDGSAACEQIAKSIQAAHAAGYTW